MLHYVHQLDANFVCVLFVAEEEVCSEFYHNKNSCLLENCVEMWEAEPEE